MARPRKLAVGLVVLFLAQSLSLMVISQLDHQQHQPAPLNMATSTNADEAKLFLHSRTSALQMGNQSTIQILNHEVGSNDDSVNATQSLDISAYLDPQFATGATLSGQVSFALWIRGSGGPNSKATVTFSLYRADANGTVQGAAIATASTGNVVFPTTYTEHTDSTTVSNLQLLQGERLKYTVAVSGNNGIAYTARWGSSLYQSYLSLPVTVPVDVASNTFVDATGQSIDTFWVGTTGANPVVSLTLASPFTVNHVDSVNATLVAPNGTVITTTSLSTTASSWQAQGAWNMTLPLDGNSVAGDWQIRYEIDSLDAMRWMQDYPGDSTAGGQRVFTNITVPVRYSGVLDLNCNDADGDALGGVGVRVTADAVRRADLDANCGAAGAVQMALPLTNLALEFVYQGVSVGTESLAFSSNQTLNVQTNVSDIVLNATHADGRPAGTIHVWVVHPNGTLMLAGTSFNSTTTLANAPMGQYVVSSSWMGNPLPNTVGTHHGTAGGSEIVINTTVTGTYVKVTDQVGTPIEGVQLIARDVTSQTIRGAATTLANGLAAFDLMTDEYVLEPVWQRFAFSSQTVEFTGEQVNITLELQQVNVSVVDVQGNGLPFATVRVLDENGQTIILGDTNATGTGDLRLPNGTYPLAVQWSSRYFPMGEFVVTPNGEWELTVPVGSFDVAVQTPEGVAIDGAIVAFTDAMAVQWSGLVTNVTGQTSIRAPEGTVQLHVELDGFLIHEQNLTLDFNTSSLVIPVDMPDVFVHVTTDDGEVLDSVELQLKTFGDSILDAGLTDANGTATLRAPDGVHVLTARWLGIEIGEMNITVSGTTFVNFTASAYVVTFNALDRSSQPVDNVTLLIRKASSTVILATAQTAVSGQVELLLPSGAYTVQGSWFGIEVLNTNLSVSEATTINVVVEVISVEVNVVDVDGEALNGARVDLLRNGVFASTSTVNLNGRAQFRVAAGDYTAIVTWFGIEVNRTDVTFEADTTALPTLVAEVASVFVEVVDRDGLAVDGVTFTVRDGFIILDQNISANGGNLRLRLPYGEYQATATLSGILVAELTDFQSPGVGVVQVEIALEQIQLTLVDLDDRALSEVQVFARDPRTFGVMMAQSDENGIATLRLPEGAYDLDFSWQGRIIATENLTVPDQANLTYQLQLREHTMFVRDADANIASGVTLTLRDANDRVLSTEIIGPSGSVTTLVGAGVHRLSISWAGLGLYTENYVPLDSSTHDVELPIGQVELNVVDLDDKPLSDLGVILRLDTGRLLDVVTTNETGSASLYLPNSEVVVTLQLQGYVIFETPVALNGQDLVELVAPVRTRTFSAVDTVGEPVRGAEVYLETDSGLTVGPSVSDGTGAFTVLLLPGELWMNVHWNGRLVVEQNLTDNQAPDVLVASVHEVGLTFSSPLDGEVQVVRNVVIEDDLSGWSYTLPPSQSLQLPSGNLTVSLVWQDVALPEIGVAVTGSETQDLTLPLVVVEMEYLRIDRSDLDAQVMVRVEQGVWSHEFTTFGNATFVVPPGTVNMKTYLDDVLLKQTTLRSELTSVLLPVETYTLEVERTDGVQLQTERVEVAWPGSAWTLMSEAGVVGPSNVDWDARISYNGWYFERAMSLPAQGTLAKILVEVANVSVDVVDRNGDFLKDTSCTFTGAESVTTVLTQSATTSVELLVGNYDYVCRVPSAGAVEEDGRRSAKEYTGQLNVNDGVNNELRIEVVELPFSETAQVKGILSSSVGLALGVAALFGWAVALISLNKLLGKKNEEASTGPMVGVSPTNEAEPRSQFDVDDLFNQ
ncbi:MAG: hypothetical protein VW102_05385 [Poseidonia sp.]